MRTSAATGTPLKHPPDPDESRDATIGLELLDTNVKTYDFDEFYRANYQTLSRTLVIALGDLDLGSDAADEAMTRAYRKWDSVGTYDNPQGWCFRVGLNYGRSSMRKLRRRRINPDTTIDWIETTLPSPELWYALQKLERNLRDVTVCRVLLELSVKETAHHLRISEGTVKSRFSRAKVHLRKALDSNV